MDVVLINPHPGGQGLNEATKEPPLGLAYLAAVLEQNGYACQIIDANTLDLDLPETLSRISRDAKLIGFYLNSFCYTTVQELCKSIRKSLPGTKLILGGPLPSAAPHVVLSDFLVDGLIMGEGEDAIVCLIRNLIQKKPLFDKGVPGAVYRNPVSDQLIMNPPARITNLDRLPFPAYHLLPPLSAYKSRSRKNPVAAIVTSRGCPFECSFCSKDIFHRRTTFRSPENVLSEIDYLVIQLGARQIDILDDNFAIKRFFIEPILDGLIERNYGIAINLQSGIRIEILDEPLLKKMRQAGIYKLAFGVESADPQVLKLAKKRLDLAKLEEVIRLAKKEGFLVYGFFIIGLPGETEDGFQRTLGFARKMDFDVANFTMAIPFIGTELYAMVKKDGRFLIDTSRNIDVGFYGGQVFFEYGDSKADDILHRYKAAYKEFYSFQRNLKLLSQIRSWAELRWVLDSFIFVFRGIVSK
jgi:radical SAM superfamily enzyme YgiQ (UPF0313 family)